MHNKPTHLDLFSGIGGFSLAAEWAGFQTIGFSEIDSYASKVLHKHWPHVPNYGDIRHVKNIKADLVTGGFPCQPFSLAGKRKGAADDRFLWPEMCRVIAESGAAWVVGENVPGIIGMELDRVLSDLEGIGYSCLPPFVIPACAVDAKHNRARTWIVAHANSARLEGRSGTSIPGGCSADGHVGQGARWSAEPSVRRVAYGLPRRVDRLRCLGNAIVPQVAYQILKPIADLLLTPSN